MFAKWYHSKVEKTVEEGLFWDFNVSILASNSVIGSALGFELSHKFCMIFRVVVPYDERILSLS